MSGGEPLHIVGGGPAGLLLALLADARGQHCIVHERRPDPRATPPEAGRSINLALAARGIEALSQAGLTEALADLLVPMRGRQLHAPDGTQQFVPYGSAAHEVIFSISRAALAQRLVEAAAARPGISLRFGQRCDGLAPDGRVRLHDLATGESSLLGPGRVIGADGAGSVLRNALRDAGHLSVREELLDHDYKELTIPARGGSPALVREALHIWPRGGFMLIALPNADDSFTATLFLPREGPVSFAALRDAAAVDAFFAREFPDARALMPDLVHEFAAHRQGLLGTVYCSGWRAGESLLLVGDAAHAIVPFHGQGMNCAFEDCRLLDRLLGDGGPAPFARYEAARMRDTAAIARMALENYHEMRDAVRDPRFQLQKALSIELERRHPGHFVPRYSMVTFHAEIPYSLALERGALQQRILDALTAPSPGGSLPALSDIDLARGDALVRELLPPLPRA